MRLLAYWIVFATLLVVFVPAFSMIFSPAYITKSSECPPCNCTPCEYPSVAGRLIIFGHYIPDTEIGIVFYEFYFDLMKFDNYKYVIVLPFPRERVSGAVFWNPDNLEETWFLTVKYLNSTHSYIEIYESMKYSFWYQIDFRNWDEVYSGRYIHVYIMREDLDPRSVLT